MVGNFSLYRKGTMRARALPLARALCRRGHSVCLVLPALDAPTEARARDKVDGIPIRHLAAPGPPGLRHLLTAVQLARATLGAKPDVVHAFKPISFAGAVAMGARALRSAHLAEARLVVDADDWEGTGGWVDLEARPRWQRWLVDRQERWGIRHADTLTVASRHLETLAWSLGVTPGRVHYVPNGVEGVLPRDEGLRRHVRDRLGLGDHPVLLLYTRFFEFPLERVVQLLEQVAAAVPAVRLLVVGSGFWGEEGQLAEALARRGLAANAILVGWSQPADLPGYFAAADLAIYPLADTLVNRAKCPAKLVELMAAGVPVVAERVGQAAEYLEHGVSGMLVPVGNSEAFAKAIHAAIEDEGLRRRLAEGARQRVAACFTWDRLAPRVEAAYGLAPRPAEAEGLRYA